MAAGRPVEAAKDVHQRRFAGTGRPHERDKIAFLEAEIEDPQHVNRHVPLKVIILDEFLNANDGGHGGKIILTRHAF